jgi:hypothetical protein
MVTFNISKKTLLYIGILLLSLIINIFAIRSCSDNKKLNENNIIALTDSIEYYKIKTGEVVASKTILEGNLQTLKIANDSLYNVIKKLDVKNPDKIIYVDNIIERPSIDTIWHTDTIICTDRIVKQFVFNDEFRTLEGNIFAENTSLGLNILKDKVYFDYVLTIENNKVHIVSNNPYIQYNEITGLTLTNYKPKWTIELYGNLEYSFNEKNIFPIIGIETGYNQFKGFFEYNINNNDKVLGVGYKYTFNIK